MQFLLTKEPPPLSLGNKKSHSVEWCHEEDWMAVGGDDGLLKIIKINDASASTSIMGNQTLVGHSGRVLCIAWNPTFRKLSTADEHGLIIVWSIEENRFVEQMINSSDHAPVGDVKWSPDGENVCIAYGDGAIVVGSVEGKRLWSKSLNVSHQRLAWSPDSMNILIANTDDSIIVYDMSGNIVQEFDDDGAAEIVDLSWNCNSSANGLSLAIAHSYGDIFCRNDLQHESKSTIECGITIETCQWIDGGKSLAVCGVLHRTDPNEPPTPVVNFYSRDGAFLDCLEVPTTECIFDILWDASGKMLIAFENSFFFANIHTQASRAMVGNTMAYISSGTATVSHFDLNARYVIFQLHVLILIKMNRIHQIVKNLFSSILHPLQRSSVTPSTKFCFFVAIDTCV
jgi:WD repeat-containing protein 35